MIFNSASLETSPAKESSINVSFVNTKEGNSNPDIEKSETIKLIYAVSGDFSVISGMHFSKIMAGEFIIAGPQHQFNIETEKGKSAKICLVTIDFIHAVWPEWVLVEGYKKSFLGKMVQGNRIKHLEQNSQIREVLQKMIKYSNTNELYSLSPCHLKIYANLLLLECFSLMNGHSEREEFYDSSNELSVKNFIKNLEANVHCEWDLNLMARKCGMGRSSFTEYCKKLTNCTPLEYLRYIRIKKARKLLRNFPDLNIKDIAMKCGYHSNQYFTREFRRLTGFCPSEFRESV